jgi:hypothetical protein
MLKMYHLIVIFQAILTERRRRHAQEAAADTNSVVPVAADGTQEENEQDATVTDKEENDNEPTRSKRIGSTCIGNQEAVATVVTPNRPVSSVTRDTSPTTTSEAAVLSGPVLARNRRKRQQSSVQQITPELRNQSSDPAEPTRKRRRRTPRITRNQEEAVSIVTPNRPVSSATRDPSPNTAEQAEVLSGTVVAPNRRKRQKSSVTATARIKTEPEETNDPSTDQRPSEPLWYESINTSRSTRRVFRVRQFKKDAKCETDKHGQKPSLWAVQEGYILSCARAIPLDIKTSEAAKDFLQDTAQAMAYCRNRSTFSDHSNSITLFVNGYKMFCEMQKGDIVVLLLSPGGTGKGRACFGVVESDEIPIWSHDKLLAEGFPSPIMFEVNRAWDDKRVMLRRIKWMREGLVRDLPDQSTGAKNAHHVPWLAESGPFWMSNVTEKALERVSTAEFMDRTKNVIQRSL